MADEKNLILNANQDLGEIVIAPEVIEAIIGITASKVEDVYGMRGAFASNITELLGRATHGKGVCLANEEGGLEIGLHCYLEYGVSIPRVATEMQERINQQVLFMADTDLSEVSIYAVAVISKKLEQPAIGELFEDEEEESG